MDFCACAVVFWTGCGIAYQTYLGFCPASVRPEAGLAAKAIAWADNRPDHENVDP